MTSQTSADKYQPWDRTIVPLSYAEHDRFYTQISPVATSQCYGMLCGDYLENRVETVKMFVCDLMSVLAALFVWGVSHIQPFMLIVDTPLFWLIGWGTDFSESRRLASMHVLLQYKLSSSSKSSERKSAAFEERVLLDLLLIRFQETASCSMKLYDQVPE